MYSEEKISFLVASEEILTLRVIQSLTIHFPQFSGNSKINPI